MLCFFPSIWNTLAKNKLFSKNMWAMDTSFRRYIQAAGNIAKKKSYAELESARSTSVSHVTLNC